MSKRVAFALSIALLCAVCLQAAIAIVQNSPYSATGVSTAALSTNQTLGNANFVATNYCSQGACGVTGCNGTASVTDNAGSHGGSGNNTYTLDSNSTANETVCVDLARSFNITSTTSTNTITVTLNGTDFFQRTFAFEVSGLGVPALDSTGVTSSASPITSVATSGSCNAGDFAWAMFASGANMTAGAGWTAVGSPTQNQVVEWQTVLAAGVVTATVTGGSGNSGAAIACYNPTFCTQPSAFLVGSLQSLFYSVLRGPWDKVARYKILNWRQWPTPS
jgi:hypothetical protein